MTEPYVTCWYESQKVVVTQANFRFRARAKQGLTLACPADKEFGRSELQLEINARRPLSWGPRGPDWNQPVQLAGEGTETPTWGNLALYKSSHTDGPGMTWAMVSACQCGESPCREEYPVLVDTHDIPVTLWHDVLRTADTLGAGWIKFPKIFKIVIDWGDEWRAESERFTRFVTRDSTISDSEKEDNS